MNPGGSSHDGDPLSVQDYVNTYYVLASQNLGTQVLIVQIARFPLKVIVSTIT